MKTTIKLFLIVSMFCATAFADGNQGVGGYKCGDGPEPCPPPCEVNCGDGFAAASNDDAGISVILITEIAKKFYQASF